MFIGVSLSLQGKHIRAHRLHPDYVAKVRRARCRCQGHNSRDTFSGTHPRSPSNNSSSKLGHFSRKCESCLYSEEQDLGVKGRFVSSSAVKSDMYRVSIISILKYHWRHSFFWLTLLKLFYFLNYYSLVSRGFMSFLIFFYLCSCYWCWYWSTYVKEYLLAR